ncbi:MAG: hypothetical protein IJ856_05240 [Candidatus Methanomethylophilaceae archaeon]|nr:hypothetical protein [Candidatus Methanomethylophilaceae archaeon]
MDHKAKVYAAVTVAVTAIVCIVLFLVSGGVDSLWMVVTTVALYPCVAFGLYMYLEGEGARHINGIDLSKMNEDELRNYCSTVGLFMVVSMVLLTVSIALILKWMVVAVLLIVVSMALVFVPFVRKGWAVSRPFKSGSVARKATVFAVFTLLAVVPTIVSNSIEGGNAVTVEFSENGFSVKAPMVDRTFEYSKVTMLELDPDFDKGSRMMGYGTSTICSGTFRNDAFGSYTLASYTKVQPCVFFEYEGRYFAFNQSSAADTEDVYQRLVSHVGERAA